MGSNLEFFQDEPSNYIPSRIKRTPAVANEVRTPSIRILGLSVSHQDIDRDALCGRSQYCSDRCRLPGRHSRQDGVRLVTPGKSLVEDLVFPLELQLRGTLK